MLYGRFIQSKQVDKVAPFHDPLKTLKLKTIAFDCVIKKDNNNNNNNNNNDNSLYFQRVTHLANKKANLP